MEWGPKGMDHDEGQRLLSTVQVHFCTVTPSPFLFPNELMLNQSESGRDGNQSKVDWNSNTNSTTMRRRKAAVNGQSAPFVSNVVVHLKALNDQNTMRSSSSSTASTSASGLSAHGDCNLLLNSVSVNLKRCSSSRCCWGYSLKLPSLRWNHSFLSSIDRISGHYE